MANYKCLIERVQSSRVCLTAVFKFGTGWGGTVPLWSIGSSSISLSGQTNNSVTTGLLSLWVPILIINFDSLIIAVIPMHLL